MTAQPVIKRLKLDELVIDKRYQRPLHSVTVKKITTGFDPVLCGVLEVSKNGGDHYAVFDGQHRLAALIALGETTWPCRVHELTAQEQASKFVLLQTERRTVHPVDRHSAAVFAGDELAVKVNNLVEEMGYRITNTATFGALMCVGGLYLAYERYGPAALRLALDTIDKAWGREESYGRRGPVVVGMALLMSRHSKEMDMDAFVAKLSGKTPASVFRQASAELQIGGTGSTARVHVARHLLDIYNHGRSPGTRISKRLLGSGA